VCPACEVSVGGETGDFPGSPAPCPSILAATAIDEAEAVRLGYDVAEMRRRLARPLDLPLSWSRQTFAAFLAYEEQPPTGFANETRLSASVVAREGYKYIRPDPAYCDGTNCRRVLETGQVVEVEQLSCSADLAIEVVVELETADGALRAEISGNAVRSNDSRDWQVIIHAAAQLEAVVGSLRLSPKSDMGDPVGELWLALRLTETDAYGSLTPEIRLSSERGEGAKLYAPLTGRLGVRPTTPPMGGIGAGPDAGQPR
jgi:hypothetical protein